MQSDGKPVVVISTERELEQIIPHLLKEPFVCVDTEFLRDNTFFSHLCLIQISSENNPAYCIDTLADISMEALRNVLIIPLFFKSNTIKVFHSCAQDLEIIAHIAGFPEEVIQPVFDTAIAWKFLDSEDKTISYANLVYKICGIRLDQSQTMSYWDNRPLTNMQLQYAASDVTYLIRVYKSIIEKLQELGRIEWVTEQCETQSRKYFGKPDISDSVKTVKKVGRCDTQLKKQKLSILASWREYLAMEYNCPRKWVLTDDQVVRLSLQFAKLEQEKKDVFLYFDAFHDRSPIIQLNDDELTEKFLYFLQNVIPLSTSENNENTKNEKSNNVKHPYTKEFWKDREQLKKDFMVEIKKIAIREKMCPTLLCSNKQISQFLEGESDELISNYRKPLLKKVLQRLQIDYQQLVDTHMERLEKVKSHDVPQPKHESIIKKK